MSATLDSIDTTTDPHPLPELTRAEVERYSRHLLLPEVGVEGQRKLKAARVLLVGAGGLGSPAALYLAAAGVGTLGIVDFDTVDVTNLHRQLLHGTSDVGRSKLDSAIDRLREVNPHVVVEPHNVRLTSDNALELIGAYDLVVDGTDNFQTRYLVNDACVLTGRPNVYGSIFRFDGQVSVFCTADGPCYRCLYREPPPARDGPQLRRGGRAGNSSRHRRDAAGDRGDQADPRHRRAADRALRPRRRARRALAFGKDPSRSHLPGVRHP